MDMCPSCGASNTLGAEWCNQCFAALNKPKAVVPAGVPSRTDSGHLDAATWACKSCGEVVELTQENCPSCMTSIYENFGAKLEAPTLTEKELIVKALVPGRAHSAPANPLAGVLVFMVVFMGLLFGLMLLTTTVSWAGVAVVMWSLAVWAFSIWDASQSHISARLLLQPRVSMGLGVIPLVLIVGAVLSTVRP